MSDDRELRERALKAALDAYEAQGMDSLHEIDRLRRALKVAHKHLAAAVAQSIPSDDQIIADRTRQAYEAVNDALFPNRQGDTP